VYVASFCENGDLLSQWRAYGAFGGGYAVGFSSIGLYGSEDNECEPIRILRPVIYDQVDQTDILQRWLNESLLHLPRAGTEFVYYKLLDLFSNQLMTFKHPSY